MLFNDIILARDPDLYVHQQDVCLVALTLSEALNITKEERLLVRQAALSHDIGKLMIPDQILQKRIDLTKKELATIRNHPLDGASLYLKYAPKSLHIGERILNHDRVAEIILQHHERHDGLGYPDGIKGEQICLEAKIIAIADAYSAMTANRPYGKTLNHKEALLEIERCSGTQFDPEISQVFLREVYSKSVLTKYM